MEPREYVRRLLEAYRATPGTAGVVRRPDRLFAVQLHERGVPLETASADTPMRPSVDTKNPANENAERRRNLNPAKHIWKTAA